MTEKTKIFLKKEGIDVVFPILSFVLFAVLYTGISLMSKNDLLHPLVIICMIGPWLITSLSVNIIFQTIFNSMNIIYQMDFNTNLVSNKVKSYVFFIALIVDVLSFYNMLFSKNTYLIDKEVNYILGLSLVLFFIKFLIAKYYYKTLNKYDQK